MTLTFEGTSGEQNYFAEMKVCYFCEPIILEKYSTRQRRIYVYAKTYIHVYIYMFHYIGIEICAILNKLYTENSHPVLQLHKNRKQWKPESGVGWRKRSLSLLLIKDDYRQRFTFFIAFPLLPSTVLMKDTVNKTLKKSQT